MPLLYTNDFTPKLLIY